MALIVRLSSACLFGIILFLSIAEAQGQSGYCGTKIPPGYQSVLQNHIDSVVSLRRGGSLLYPLKIHIIRRDNGTGGSDIADINQAIDVMNDDFQPINMEFYVCGSVNYIDNTSYYDFNMADEQNISVNDVPGLINIYFSNGLEDIDGTPLCGKSHWPGEPDRIFMNNPPCNGGYGVLSHEMGHFFNLLHTHETALGSELVNGSNCNSTGDLLCDTPADPGLSYTNVLNCAYTGTTTDANGQSYHPDPTNIMSYAPQNCWTRFTSQQYNRMLYTAQNVRNYFTCSTNPCNSVSVNPNYGNFINSGGSGSFIVNILPGCAWTATSSSWITVLNTLGSGTQTINYIVPTYTQPNSRTGAITVNGQVHTVTQSGLSCNYSLNSSNSSFTTSGGPGSFNVNTTAGCTWNANTSDSWITLNNNFGTGSGTITFSVTPNSSPQNRTGKIDVQGEIHTVSQDGISCSYLVTPASQNYPAANASGNISVIASGRCNWDSYTNDSWINIFIGSGSGSGTLYFTLQDNPEPQSRTGTIYIENQTHTVIQDASSCYYIVNPVSQTFGNTSGTGTIDIQTATGCSWTATTPQNWIHLTNSSGVGIGSINFSIDANNHPILRSGQVKIGGRTFIITQNAGTCHYSLSPQSQTITSSQQSLEFQVNTDNVCGWSAFTQANWIEIQSGDGTGNGVVSCIVYENTSSQSRTDSVIIENKAHVITQMGKPNSTPTVNNNFKNLTFFPNPTTGTFILEMELTQPEKLQLRILSVTGQVVYEEALGRQSGSYSKTIDLSRHAKGVYLLQIVGREGVMGRKVVVY